jgi:hypothetical protein
MMMMAILYQHDNLYFSGTQIPGAASQWWQCFLQWRSVVFILNLELASWHTYGSSLPLAVAVIGPVFPVPTPATAQQQSREHSQLPSDTNFQELRIKSGTLHTKQRTTWSKTISPPTGKLPLNSHHYEITRSCKCHSPQIPPNPTAWAPRGHPPVHHPIRR